MLFFIKCITKLDLKYFITNLKEYTITKMLSLHFLSKLSSLLETLNSFIHSHV